MSKSNYRYLLGLIIGMMLSVGSFGLTYAEQTLPKHYPAQFDAEGFIHSTNLGKQEINLDGIKYSTNISTVAYDRNGKSTSLLSLSKGTKVGVEFIRHEKKMWEINKVWILPSNYKVEPHSG